MVLVPASELLRRDYRVVGHFHHILERDRRRGMDSDHVAHIHHAHNLIPVRHSAARAMFGRKVSWVSERQIPTPDPINYAMIQCNSFSFLSGQQRGVPQVQGVNVTSDSDPAGHL